MDSKYESEVPNTLVHRPNRLSKKSPKADLDGKKHKVDNSVNVSSTLEKKGSPVKHGKISSKDFAFNSKVKREISENYGDTKIDMGAVDSLPKTQVKQKQSNFWILVLKMTFELFCSMFVVLVRSSSSETDSNPLSVGLSLGSIVFLNLYIFRHASGSHMNPVVTLVFLLLGEITVSDSLCYLLSHTLGGFLAGVFLLLFFGFKSQLGVPELNPDYYSIQGFFIETIFTFLIITVIVMTTYKKKNPDNVGISLCVSLAYVASTITAFNITGSAFNPLQYLIPSLFSGFRNASWIYFFGPLTGSILSYLFCRSIFSFAQ